MSAAADRSLAWEHWAAWKARCALVRCEAETQAALRGFAYHRFHYYARRVTQGLGGAVAILLQREVDARTAWHYFETYLVVDRLGTGKRYKDWLFARLERESVASGVAGARGADGAEPAIRPENLVEAGATLLMRTVVREYLRRELTRTGQASLQAPLRAGDGASLTLADFIPDATESPAEAAARAEYPALAATVAREVLGGLERRTRVALLAKALGRNLNESAVEAAAQCRKSVLSAEYSAFRAALKARVLGQFVDEGVSGQGELLLRVLEALQTAIFLWGRSEPGCAPLYIGVEGAGADAT